MLESTIERDACGYWESLGFSVVKMKVRGWPDRLVLGAWPLIAFVEFKRDEATRLEPHQQDRARELSELRGFPCYKVTRVEDAARVSDDLEAIGVEAIRGPWSLPPGAHERLRRFLVGVRRAKESLGARPGGSTPRG